MQKSEISNSSFLHKATKPSFAVLDLAVEITVAVTVYLVNSVATIRI